MQHCSMNASLSFALTRGKPYKPFSQPKRSKSGYRSSCIVSCQSEKRWSMNFRRVLTLDSRNSSVDEIKKAYRKMALQYHPDVCNASMKEESTRIFVELQEAYRTLLDQALQSDYSMGIGLEDKQRDRNWENEWENQLVELNRRSDNRKFQMDGSWGCRMRARFL